MPPRIIRLNVGGYVVQTAASTLTSGSAYFARLLSSEFTDLDAESNEAVASTTFREKTFLRNSGAKKYCGSKSPTSPTMVDLGMTSA